jgi:hypothetical protein
MEGFLLLSLMVALASLLPNSFDLYSHLQPTKLLFSEPVSLSCSTGLLQCVREWAYPDMDGYDAAACAAGAPLRIVSVSHGSTPVEFADTTGDKWQQRPVSTTAMQV